VAQVMVRSWIEVNLIDKRTVALAICPSITSRMIAPTGTIFSPSICDGSLERGCASAPPGVEVERTHRMIQALSNEKLNAVVFTTPFLLYYAADEVRGALKL